MDAIHYNVRQDNATVKKAVYIAIGISTKKAPYKRELKLNNYLVF